jgi:nucleotide-binding universal stress UspA family protein
MLERPVFQTIDRFAEPCGLRYARVDRRPPLTETLLIATDGSASSLAAVDVGVRLARERGARVTFVHSSPEVAQALFDRNPLTSPAAAEVAAADPVLEAAHARAVEAGVEAELTVLGEHGARDIASAIVGAARGMGASLVVVGVPVVVVHAREGSDAN